MFLQVPAYPGCPVVVVVVVMDTHTHPLNGPFSGTTQVGQYRPTNSIRALKANLLL